MTDWEALEMAIWEFEDQVQFDDGASKERDQLRLEARNELIRQRIGLTPTYWLGITVTKRGTFGHAMEITVAYRSHLWPKSSAPMTATIMRPKWLIHTMSRTGT